MTDRAYTPERCYTLIHNKTNPHPLCLGAAHAYTKKSIGLTSAPTKKICGKNSAQQRQTTPAQHDTECTGSARRCTTGVQRWTNGNQPVNTGVRGCTQVPASKERNTKHPRMAKRTEYQPLTAGTPPEYGRNVAGIRPERSRNIPPIPPERPFRFGGPVPS